MILDVRTFLCCKITNYTRNALCHTSEVLFCSLKTAPVNVAFLFNFVSEASHYRFARIANVSDTFFLGLKRIFFYLCTHTIKLSGLVGI